MWCTRRGEALHGCDSDSHISQEASRATGGSQAYITCLGPASQHAASSHALSAQLVASSTAQHTPVAHWGIPPKPFRGHTPTHSGSCCSFPYVFPPGRLLSPCARAAEGLVVTPPTQAASKAGVAHHQFLHEAAEFLRRICCGRVHLYVFFWGGCRVCRVF